jgi:hypothetical protein
MDVPYYDLVNEICYSSRHLSTNSQVKFSTHGVKLNIIHANVVFHILFSRVQLVHYAHINDKIVTC